MSPPTSSPSSQKENESVDTTISDTTSLSNFLETFFNTAFFLCICPFRVKKTPNENSKQSKPFIICTWWPQTILCALLTILSVFWMLRDIRISIPSERSPAVYVQFALALMSTIVKLVILENLWSNRDAFLDIVNCVANHRTSYKFAEKAKLFGIATIYIVMGIILFFTIRDHGVRGGIIHDWSASRWAHSLVYAGRYNFFVSHIPFPLLCNDSNNTVRSVLDEDVVNYVESVDTLLAVLVALGSYTYFLLGPFCDFLMLMVTLTLWTAVKTFCVKVKSGTRSRNIPTLENGAGGAAEDNKNTKLQKLQNGEDDADVVSIEMSPSAKSSAEWTEIYEGFQFLKHLSDLINKSKAMGLYVTLVLVEYVLYYAVFFDLVFAEGDVKDWGRRVDLLLYLASTCLILLLCADISHRIGALKGWLTIEENRENVPTDLIVILINQVDSKRVAISGSKIFPITYHSLCGMLGVTATYFILCVKDKTGLSNQIIKC